MRPTRRQPQHDKNLFPARGLLLISRIFSFLALLHDRKESRPNYQDRLLDLVLPVKEMHEFRDEAHSRV